MPVRRRIAAALIIASFLLIHVPVPARAADATTGVIKGTLIDSSGNPMVGYKVKVIDAAGNEFEAAPTGPDGKYEIQNLQPGTYNYQILDPDGNLLTIRIPPITLQPGTAVTQPIAIVPKSAASGNKALTAWLVGGGVAIVAIALAASNSSDDDDDDDESMTQSAP